MNPQIKALDQRWRELLSQSSYARKAASPAQRNAYWDGEAKEYDLRMDQDPRRVIQVMELLREKGWLGQGKGLELGCGTGVYTIPLAKELDSLLALDISEKMKEICLEKAKAAGAENLRLSLQDWERLDLRELGLERFGDLVFSALNPSINSWENLEKMCRASRKACCLVTFSGTVENQVRWDLERLLYSREAEREEPDFQLMYPFRLLEAAGYQPEIHYTEMAWVKTHPAHLAIQRLEREHQAAVRGHPEIQEQLKQYVESHLEPDGLFRERNRAKLGILTWEV